MNKQLEIHLFYKLPSVQIKINNLISLTSNIEQQKQLCSIYLKYGEGKILDQTKQQIANKQEERLRLRGGGCGASKNGVREVQKRIGKEREKSMKKVNFQVDPDFLEQYEKITNKKRINHNMGMKSDDTKEGKEGKEVEGQVNLMEEVMKLEDCAYNFRRCLGDNIFRYWFYYQRMFELMLQYQFLAIDQIYGARSSFKDEQKKKLVELRDICKKQKDKQPALGLLFYLEFFIRLQDSSFPDTSDFFEVVSSVRKVAERLYTLGEKSINMLQGKVMDGVKEITAFITDVVNLIQEAKAKKLYKMLVNMQLERIKSKQTSQNLEEEILYYAEKFNSLVETDKTEVEEDLAIYFMIRMNYILQKRIKVGNIASEFFHEKSEIKDNQSNYQKSDITPQNPNIIKLINNLIIECQDEKLSDYFIDFIQFNVSNYSLRFASLSLQISLRIHFQNIKVCQSEIYKLLLLNTFRRYLEEEQQSIKVLLYYDFTFQEMVNAQLVEKKDENKNKSHSETKVADSNQVDKEKEEAEKIYENTIGGVKIDEKFYQEYLDYDKNWKTRVGRLTLGKSQGDLNKTATKVGDVVKAVEDNFKAGKKIIEKII